MARPATRLKYSHFRGSAESDVDEWFGEFETIAAANQEDLPSRLRVFPGLLKGEALSWYHGLTDEVKADWDELKDHFIHAFRESGGESRALSKLNKISMKDNESVRRYSQRVKSLIKKCATEGSPRLQKEWFVGGLPSTMGFAVRMAKPTTLAEAIEAAQDYEDSLHSMGKTRDKGKGATIDKKHKKKKKTRHDSSDTSDDPSSSDTSSSEEESFTETRARPNHRKGTPKANKDTARALKEVKAETHESKEVLKNLRDTMEAIRVNLASNPLPRKSIPTVRTNVWCTKCGESGHSNRECPRYGPRRVHLVNPEGTMSYWAEEEEEEGEEDTAIYQVLPTYGRGRGVTTTYRAPNPPIRQLGYRSSFPPPTYQQPHFGDNQFATGGARYPTYSVPPGTPVCYNCGSPHHFANTCDQPRRGGQGAPLTLPCQNCQQYGHDAPQCPQAPVPKVTYKQVEVPPREQTALNYGTTQGIENPPK